MYLPSRRLRARWLIVLATSILRTATPPLLLVTSTSLSNIQHCPRCCSGSSSTHPLRPPALVFLVSSPTTCFAAWTVNVAPLAVSIPAARPALPAQAPHTGSWSPPPLCGCTHYCPYSPSLYPVHVKPLRHCRPSCRALPPLPRCDVSHPCSSRQLCAHTEVGTT